MIFRFDGGAEWGGAAFDRSRRLYVNANEMPWVLTMVERPRDAGSSGREVYQRECAACHGADRKGQPPQFPALTDLRGRYTETELFTLLMSGSGRMPSFARLDWSRLNSLADYILNDRSTAVVASSPSNAAADAVPPFITDGFHKLLDPDGYPGIEPPWGTLSAIDLDTGDYAWKVPIGEYPELASRGATTGSETTVAGRDGRRSLFIRDGAGSNSARSMRTPANCCGNHSGGRRRRSTGRVRDRWSPIRSHRSWRRSRGRRGTARATSLLRFDRRTRESLRRVPWTMQCGDGRRTGAPLRSISALRRISHRRHRDVRRADVLLDADLVLAGESPPGEHVTCATCLSHDCRPQILVERVGLAANREPDVRAEPARRRR